MSDPEAEREHRVTPLELFFNLVVVFAITQVTQLMADDLSWRGLGRGLFVLAAIWWAWTGYAWLTNALEPEEALVRAGMFAAMAAMLVVALAAPHAFGANAVLFGVGYPSCICSIRRSWRSRPAGTATFVRCSCASRRRPRSHRWSSWSPGSSAVAGRSRCGASPRDRGTGPSND